MMEKGHKMAQNGTSVRERPHHCGGHLVIREPPILSRQRIRGMRDFCLCVYIIFFFFCPFLVSRESNNPFLREKVQKPKDMAGDCMYQRPPRPPIAQNVKKLQRGPVGHRNPSSGEENTRVSGGLSVSGTRGSAWPPKTEFKHRNLCVCS